MRKPILIESIRGMGIGEELRFPILRKRSVRNCIYDRLDAERMEGKSWKTHCDRKSQEFVVIRTA